MKNLKPDTYLRHLEKSALLSPESHSHDWFLAQISGADEPDIAEAWCQVYKQVLAAEAVALDNHAKALKSQELISNARMKKQVTFLMILLSALTFFCGAFGVGSYFRYQLSDHTGANASQENEVGYLIDDDLMRIGSFGFGATLILLMPGFLPIFRQVLASNGLSIKVGLGEKES